MKKQILYMVCATALLSSCHIYKSYDRPEDILTAGLYRDTVATGDTLASDTANWHIFWKKVMPSVAAVVWQEDRISLRLTRQVSSSSSLSSNRD